MEPNKIQYRNTFLILLITGFMIGMGGCKTQEPVSGETNRPSSEHSENSGDSGTEEAKSLDQLIETSEVFAKNFTGFVLYNPDNDSTLYSMNEAKYFTPASNTKLYTFYAGLMTLPDTLPALEYINRGDSLIIWGTGNPVFLHPDFNSEKVFRFLKDHSGPVFYADNHYQDELLGPGWSWGDYQYYYSTEKSPFPMYGNVVEFQIEEITQTRIKKDNGEYAIKPAFFRDRLSTDLIKKDQGLIFRDFNENTYYYDEKGDTSEYTSYRPFHYTPELITEMLSDTLGKEVSYLDIDKPSDAQMIYSGSSDSVYKKMLQPSDNFLAEQLLLTIASERNLPLNSSRAIDYVKTTYLDDMPDDPIWEDGSGLSRYNMFTPRTMVELLRKIDAEFEDDEHMFSFFPAGGKSGTIQYWYANRDDADKPYVFAKTGTLRNNHCLSGYLVTESGEKYIFSFMNNHYISSSSEVKAEMEKVLWHLYKHY